ncbi:MAG: hypothetical protein BMS9Abin12_2364 [Acidimicrobiia bacterium]|nr:MAG: hypothetical protein BMS9Abin12_2364 [Acidimicrobiia bacterium]
MQPSEQWAMRGTVKRFKMDLLSRSWFLILPHSHDAQQEIFATDS